MRPPRTYHIREFINRGQSIVGNNLVFDKDTVSHITKELADILAYVLELENKIDDLQIKFDESQITAVELIGEKF
jgi:hypothetical protein